MTMTKTNLATAVLQRLGVIGTGETPDANDAALVTTRYESLYPQLRKIGLAPFSETSIDTWAETGVTKIVAAECGPEFGWSDRIQLLELWRNQGKKELREQVAMEPRNHEIRAHYI